MRNSWIRFVFGLLCLAASACTTPRVSMREGPREYVARDYSTVLKRWTREAQLISMDELDNVLTVTATYESWDFRWAYAIRYAEDYRLTVEQRTNLLERSLAETRGEHQFYVSLYAQRHNWSDLKAEQPAWTVRLIDDSGGETAPTDIEPIPKPGAIERTYYPYTSVWRRSYRIRFPRTRPDGSPAIDEKARWFGLRFAGAQGNDALVWQID